MDGKRVLGAGLACMLAGVALGQSTAPGGGAGSVPATAAAASTTVAATGPVATGPATWITRAQLDKMKFASVMDPKPTGEGAMVFADLQAGIMFGKDSYHEGEEIRATLVVHSLMDNLTRVMRARADLGGIGAQAAAEGSARLQLVRKQEGGAEQVIADIKPAGGGAKALTQKALVVKPGDYWANSGDVRNLGGGKLAAGDYVLRFWMEGQRAEGQFTVTAGGAAERTLKKVAAQQMDVAPGQGMVFSMSGGWQTRKAVAAKAVEEVWPMESPYPSPRNWADFEPALGLGIGEGTGERYYARLSEVPAADDFVAIKAAFVGKGANHFKITLSPQAKGKQIPRYPSVYLLVQNLGDKATIRGYNEREYIQTGDSVAFVRPVVIDITLPESGGPNMYFQGKARIWAVVASDPVWYGPVEGQEEDGNMLAKGRAVPAARWTGMVRSAAVEVELKRPGEEDAAGAQVVPVGPPPALAPD